MLLKKLIKNCPKNIENQKINGLSQDTRSLKKGNLFFALKGEKFDGEKFIKKAIAKGAKAVITSNNKIKNIKNIIIKVDSVKDSLMFACKNFYKKKPKNIIAVTGTNGKTSVASFFHQFLQLNNIPSASIGTLGIIQNKKKIKLNLTSPNIILLHKNLQKLKINKIDHVIIEASSHGLKQGRLNGIDFKAGIFTSFSQDHLDYHKTMKNYLNAKLVLFNKLLHKKKYIITDKSNKEYFKLKNIAKKRKLKIITIKKNDFNLIKKKTNLVGDFQIKNILMAISALKICKINKSKIYKVLNKIRGVEGRLELARVLYNKAKIYIDYAHTPDALQNSLKALQNHYKKDLTIVFGCGGERDISKRPLMAKIANKFCSKIIVTDDNPRSENPKKIRSQILKYINKKKSSDIGNRTLAIKKALQESNQSETILIAGKGHENTQQYGNKIYNISDKKIVKKIKIKTVKNDELNKINNFEILKSITKTKKKYYFDKICINSNQISKNNLFLAIKGPNKDGHNFIDKAFKSGANCSVAKKGSNKKIIKVKNTLSFLNTFAKYKRKNSEAKIIAVTGSSGKTTNKTLLSKTLKLYASTYSSPKSFNNHIGVPLSVSNLDINNKYGVFEIGMSRKGEINLLSKLVNPEIAIITNIGEAHIENFKAQKYIAKAKAEIINNIKKDGTLILNRDDKYFNYLNKSAKRKKIKVITFGFSDKSDVSIQKNKVSNKFIINIFKNKIKVKNIHLNNLSKMNLLSCLSVLYALKLDLSKINKFIDFFKPLSGRGKIYKVERYNKLFNLIDESYNSNPSSAKQAIINLNNLKTNSKSYIILGDMLELGQKSEYYHKRLSTILNKSKVNKVFVYGNDIMTTYKNLLKSKRGNIIQNKEDLDVVLKNVIEKDDYLMIKGSNATGLYKFSEALKKESFRVI